MKNRCLSILLLLLLTLISFSSFSQIDNEEPLLGLPGDDLDLYATLDLFQKSKTIEDFEKALNSEKAGIVNLDLNNDGKADFIKVETEKDGDDFLFILQDPISEKETQDVAVIAVSKDKSGKVSMQIIGDEKLYGKDYVVEPRSEAIDSVTANPGYVGDEPVTVNVPATTQVIVVESAPIVQYVYSPVYVPYVPPFYYGFYPPYWRPVAIVSIGIYRHNHYYHHNNYHGGHGNVNINIHNHNSYNRYSNNSRNSSRTVNNNINNGNFKTSGQRGSRPSTSQNRSASNKAATSNRTATSNRSPKSNNRASTTTKRTPQSNNRASTTKRKPQTNRASNSRPSSSRSSYRSSRSRSMGGASRSSFGGGRSSGGGRTMSRGGGRRR